MRQDLSARCTLLTAASEALVYMFIGILATALNRIECPSSVAYQQAILHGYVLCNRRVST